MRRIFLSLIFTLFLTGLLLGRADTTRAGMDIENIRYTSVKVKYGDSLESISKEYNNVGVSLDEYIEQVMEMNGMDDRRVHPGCFILVSYKLDR